MRVLIVVGSERVPPFISNLIMGLRDAGVHVFVYGKNLRASEWPGVGIVQSDFKSFSFINVVSRICVAFVKDPARVLAAWRYVDASPFIKVRIKRLYRIVRILEVAPDIVHFQWALHIQDFQKIIRQGKLKVVVSLRGMQVNATPYIQPEVGRLFTTLFPGLHFHAVSEALKNEAHRWGALRENIRVIYSPTPSHLLDSFSMDWTPVRDPLKMLSIGRFHWKKGYTYAIEAVARLKELGRNIEYTIIAHGDVPGEILYQIRDRGLENHVRISKGIPHAEIVAAMKRHSLFVLPSVEEGIANVVLEAMAAGLPVLSTDCGGMTEVVDPNETGWIVPVRDADAMARAIEDYSASSDEKISNMRQKAHDRVQQQFSFHNNIREFISFYTWVIQR